MAIKALLRTLTWSAAVIGGLIALLVGGMTVVSVALRFFTTQPIQGDVEMVQMGIAIAISLCIAWCQMRGANIIVDFFTQSARPAALRALDGLGCLAMAVMYCLLAWRTTVGAFAVHEAYETSMTLELPMWWAYAALAPGLALAALVALVQAWMHFTGQDLSRLHGQASTEEALA